VKPIPHLLSLLSGLSSFSYRFPGFGPYLLASFFLQIFLSFFKTLVGKEIAVELKNDVVMTGTLHSVDQYLNIKLLNVKVVNPEKYPQLCALQNCFIRGSVVRYIQIPPEHVDTELLQDAARKENAPASASANTATNQRKMRGRKRIRGQQF
jgi:U6 snRNA-associated Sm-like protein LSm2